MRDAKKNFNTSVKNVVRTQLFQVAAKKTKKVCNALMMPARECLCVKEALRVGLFTTDTNIVAIESDKESAQEIKKELQRLGFKKFKVIRQHLIKITEHDLKRGLCKPSKGLGRGFKHLNNTKTNFDFVYLDLMGTPCAKTEKWLTSKLNEVIQWSTPVAMTYYNADRTNNTLGRCCDLSYKFSNHPTTNNNSTKAADMTIEALSKVGKNRIVKYGRAYKNSRQAVPMVTFLTGYGLKQKPETYKSFAYDLGYKNR
jgi:16S rRNA G966 N2-methylase RsmD